ncbi:hypothetical protein [Bacillus subtilis]|uniref:hypothetical protein n=1 Tax=Bacillus subtilis TaxID=1423 RepID=UPI001BDB993D|nr:hypothetical protein [Bacillus subtilis]
MVDCKINPNADLFVRTAFGLILQFIFYQAIDEMLANASPSDKLSKRLQAIFAQASISRRDMLGAMIGAGMNIATAKSESFAVNELNSSISMAIII